MKVRGLMLASLLAIGMVSAQSNVKLIGVGASSAKGVVETFIKNAGIEGLAIDYQSAGTADSKKRLLEDNADFAVLETPLSNEEQARIGRSVHIPVAVWSLHMTYNLPTVKEQIRLSRRNLAQIFLGKITRWNAPALKADNPTINLPDLPIVLLLRPTTTPSSSGAVLTDYLSKISNEWVQIMGRGANALPKWPHGTIISTTITRQFKDTVGGLAYFDVTSVKTNKFQTALLENASGKWLDGLNAGTISEAAADKPLPGDTRTYITDGGGNAYPLVGFTWVVFRRDLATGNRTRAQADTLLNLVWWMVHEGQNHNERVGYGKIPALAQVRGASLLGSVTYNKQLLR